MWAAAATPSQLPISPPRTRDHSPQKLKTHAGSISKQGHTFQTLENWQRVHRTLRGNRVTLDGNNLEVADVVAVAKFGASATITDDPQVLQRINDSIRSLHKHLQAGHLVHGVTTGFGGSADTRTTDLEALQRALIQMQNSGVLTEQDLGRPLHGDRRDRQSLSMDFEEDFDHQSMPTAWVRASMLTRCNTIIRGHSAVRKEVADAIMTLLRHNMTPVVPLRGSISASGDLSPLSYIAAAIEGSPDVFVRCGQGTQNVMSAQEALKSIGVEPVVLRAKEGLGLLNGTAFSSATASLAIYQAQEMAVLSQILTTMGLEAMLGTAESFYPQIAAMRPHPGQVESAANILSYLTGSKLAQCVRMPKNATMAGLCQDRYAWRTASQWIGPQLEDLLQSQTQLEIELNSTTDNPLIDTDNDHILHGGNFQAAVVTSTMDRTRLALEKLGRILFAQAAELVNPVQNKGLPANLASDDPSLSFTCKGVDINMAAYASELGFLANPVGNHVMSAEMHNQAVNSLALISVRYTMQALDVLQLMSAAYLFMACQALDLRVLQVEFTRALTVELRALLAKTFGSESQREQDLLEATIVASISTTWPSTTHLDLADRCSTTAQATLIPLVQYFTQQEPLPESLPKMARFTSDLQHLMQSIYNTIREDLYTNYLTTTTAYLGNASRVMYQFIRKDLGLGFHRGLAEHPTQPTLEGMPNESLLQKRTIGSQISIIFQALKDGRASHVMRSIVETGSQQRV